MGCHVTSLLQLKNLDEGPGKTLLDATQAIGFSKEVAQAGLLAEFDAWEQPGAMEALSRRIELLDAEACPKNVLLIAAGTLPVSTLRHVLFARSLGANVLLKCATGQEWVGDAIGQVDPGVLATPFSRDDVGALRGAIDQVDTVVALGSDESLDDIKGHVPFHKTFVGYGHRVSAAWVSSPTEAHLQGLAEDLLMWDQAGCLSPQVLWTHESPTEVANARAKRIEHIEHRFPRVLSPWAARERHASVAFGHMRGQVSQTDTSTLIALSESSFRPSPRHRLLWVLPANEDALQAVVPQLSTLALHGTLGLDLPPHVRVCEPGSMQRPSLEWKQDGEDPLTALLRSS
jgi:hypothetical protein